MTVWSVVDSSLRSEWRIRHLRFFAALRMTVWSVVDSSADASEWRVWWQKPPRLRHSPYQGRKTWIKTLLPVRGAGLRSKTEGFFNGDINIKLQKSQVKMKIWKWYLKTSKTHKNGYRFVWILTSFVTNWIKNRSLLRKGRSRLRFIKPCLQMPKITSLECDSGEIIDMRETRES